MLQVRNSITLLFSPWSAIFIQFFRVFLPFIVPDFVAGSLHCDPPECVSACTQFN